MIVAVDGPAGAGKSSVCERIAKDLGWFYVNSGVFYRAIAYLFQTEDLVFSQNSPDSFKTTLSSLWNKFEFGISSKGFFSTKIEVSSTLFTASIAKKASEIATFSFIREFVNQKIQACLSTSWSYIVEGRDAATKIAPQAELKIYLDASLEIRANRRANELVSKKLQTKKATLLEEINFRDQQDKTRSIDPLVITPKSIIIDTTFLEFEQVVGVIKNLIVAASE